MLITVWQTSVYDDKDWAFTIWFDFIEPAVEFLKKQAASLNLPVSIYYPVNEQKPVVVMTWKGSKPKLSSIMLNSHMDVVPV